MSVRVGRIGQHKMITMNQQTNHTAPHHIASHHTKSHHTTPHQITSYHTTPYHITSHHTTRCLTSEMTVVVRRAPRRTIRPTRTLQTLKTRAIKPRSTNHVLAELAARTIEPILRLQVPAARHALASGIVTRVAEDWVQRTLVVVVQFWCVGQGRMSL